MELLNQEYDPLLGVTTQHHVLEDGRVVIKKSADITPHVEYSKLLANADEYTKNGIKAGMWHVGHIDPITIVDLRTKCGIDVYTAGVREIVAGLKKLGRDHLITTRGRI